MVGTEMDVREDIMSINGSDVGSGGGSCGVNGSGKESLPVYVSHWGSGSGARGSAKGSARGMDVASLLVPEDVPAVT